MNFEATKRCIRCRSAVAGKAKEVVPWLLDAKDWDKQVVLCWRFVQVQGINNRACEHFELHPRYIEATDDSGT